MSKGRSAVRGKSGRRPRKRREISKKRKRGRGGRITLK